MSKLFQITEEDLTVLEETLPALMWENPMACNNPVTRKQWDAVKKTLSNVRWNYGPPEEVGEVPA